MSLMKIRYTCISITEDFLSRSRFICKIFKLFKTCRGIYITRELVSFSKNDLLKFRNFGKKSLTELRN